MSVWAERALLDGHLVDRVLIGVDAAGRIGDVSAGVPPPPGCLKLGTVVPGVGNGHSHAFHRLLRGRTHDGSGDFWLWRQTMYREAAHLTPDGYRALATAVFAEMADAGYTAVGEFHYLHHRPDGSAYPGHEMELALADAAQTVGIRLVLLDTCYLAGGIGTGLLPGQVRFGDGTARRWLERWHRLRDAIAARGSPSVTLGAAVHSVRAVPRDEIGVIARELPADVPVHVHLSEQVAENDQCRAAHGLTPAALLGEAGLLRPQLAAVHATHLTEQDIALLGEAGVGVVVCPTTEADLGDGIGPARDLADAGCPIAIGSDQNAVVDPFLELRGLEYGERLGSSTRGRFSPAELWAVAANGYRVLGLGDGCIAPGRWCDLIEVDQASVRTAGSEPAQLVMSATSADVTATVVAGRRLPRLDPGSRYRQVFAERSTGQ